jgi:hypothetical protein
MCYAMHKPLQLISLCTYIMNSQCTAHTKQLLEKLHLTETAAEQSGQQRHLVEGLKYGARHMGRTLVKGLTGVITQPVRGAKDHGTVGFVTVSCLHTIIAKALM